MIQPFYQQQWLLVPAEDNSVLVGLAILTAVHESKCCQCVDASADTEGSLVVDTDSSLCLFICTLQDRNIDLLTASKSCLHDLCELLLSKRLQSSS